MRGNTLKQLRRASGLTLAQYGEAIGLRGTPATIARTMRRMEESMSVPRHIAVRALGENKTRMLPGRFAEREDSHD